MIAEFILFARHVSIHFRIYRQRISRSQIVVIIKNDLSSNNMLRHIKKGQAVISGRVTTTVPDILQRMIPVDRNMRLPLIGEFQYVPITLKLEIIINALVLQQPAHEIKIRFVILNRVFAFFELPTQIKFKVGCGNSRIGQNFSDNLVDRHVLKNPTVT